MGSPKLPRGRLDIELIEGHDTKGTEGLGIGRADPYCRIILADLKDRSRTCRDGGSKPVWNQTLTLNLNASDRKYNELTIALFNDNYYRKDNPFGEARIDLAKLVSEKGNSIPANWYPVFLDGDRYGSINVGFKFTPEPDPSASKDDAKPNSTVTRPNPAKEDNYSPQGNAVLWGDDKANDAAKDSSSAANGGTPAPKGPKKPSSTPGEGESKLAKENDDKPYGQAPEEDSSAQDTTDGNSSVANSGTPMPKGPEEPNDHEGKPASEISTEDNSTQYGKPSTEGDQRKPTKLGEGSEDNNTHDQDADDSDKRVEKGSGKLGGLWNGALEASKGLGRKFSFTYTAVPTLVIAFLVLAAIKRKGRDVPGETSGSNAASLRNGNWQGGMPTSSRQKILFNKIHGTNQNP